MDRFKAIFSDYDGTITGIGFKISPAVKEAIEKWQKSGKFFTVVTSKPFAGPIEEGCRFLNLTDPIITLAGAEIVDPKSGNAIASEILSENEVNDILNEIENTGYEYEINDHNFVYSHDYLKLQKIFPHKKYKDLKGFNLQGVLKIRIITTDSADEENADLLKRMKRVFKKFNIIEGKTEYSRGIDITSEMANKHLAVLKLCEQMGFDPKKIIGIGDGPNDYPLLSACGYKVAMANAPKEIREIADFIAPTYKEDGVAVFINNLLENKI